MSSTNQRLIDQEQDERTELNVDTQPYYRRYTFSDVWNDGTALRRKTKKAKDNFQRAWLTEQRTLDGAMDRFNEQFDKTLKSSEERNKAVEKLLSFF